MEQGYLNTDIELWREKKGDYYSPSIHVTKEGLIGINVGDRVIVLGVREWHRLANKTSNDVYSDPNIKQPTQEQAYGTDCRGGTCE